LFILIGLLIVIMKAIYISLFMFTLHLGAQNPTEVFLFDMDKSYRLTNPINLSNNPTEYNNQPYFVNNNNILYSSTRNKQTDIKHVDLQKETQEWITNTPGSEFSPQMGYLPNMFTAIRLDTDGKQLLYSYDIKNGNATELIKNLKIGYYTWFDKNTIVTYTIGKIADSSKLEVHELNNKTTFTLTKNIGRCIQKIPNTNLISFVDKKSIPNSIKTFDLSTGQVKLITSILEGSEDYTWTPDGNILMGKDDILYLFDPSDKKGWTPIASLKNYNLHKISRLAISPNGKSIAIVAVKKLANSPRKTKMGIIDIGVVVNNLEKSLTFYKDILGMTEMWKFSIDKKFGKESGLTNGLSTEVTVLQLENNDYTTAFKLMSFGKHKDWQPNYIQQDLGVQYITLNVDSVDPFLKRIYKNNVELLGNTPITLSNGKTFLLIKDYDGTFIEIIGNSIND